MNDTRDCPVSTTSQAALAHAEQALWRTVAFYGDAVADLDAAIAADPAWGLAHIAKADFLLTLTEPSLVPEARRLIEAAEPLMAHANARERAHFAAATLCGAGRWREAGGLWDEILLQHPRDLLALNSAHLFDFYRGDALNLRARVARVLPEWPADDALRPFALGMHAFGLEECNLHPQAEQTGRRSLEACPRMPWAIHAVAHVLEMQGRHAEGVQWLRTRQADWAADNGLAVHLWWHLALFHLESLDTAGALQLYDAHIGGAASVVNLQWLDCAALLWRLQLLGVDVGPRWQRLAQDWAQPVEHAGHYAFNDCHALLALIGSGNLGRARSLLAAATTRAETDDGDNRAMAVEVGLPLMHALLAHAAGDDSTAIRLLYPLRRNAHHFGGSHAQRDLIDQTLLAAACSAAGDHDRAAGRAVLNERRLAKPDTPLTVHWASRLGLRDNVSA